MEKDTPDRIPFFGFIVPAAILVVVIVNLCLGRVYWPAGRRSAHLVLEYRDAWRVWGTVLFKLGMAGGILGWFGLANFSRTERAALPLLVVAIVLAASGLVIFCVGMFR